MEKKIELEGLSKATKNLVNNAVSINGAQDLILKSLLDKLVEEVTKLTGQDYVRVQHHK